MSCCSSTAHAGSDVVALLPKSTCLDCYQAPTKSPNNGHDHLSQATTMLADCIQVFTVVVLVSAIACSSGCDASRRDAQVMLDHANSGQHKTVRIRVLNQWLVFRL